MSIEIADLKQDVLQKLVYTMKKMPRRLAPADKLAVMKIQFAAAKALIDYIQKLEVAGSDEDGKYDLPKTPKELKRHLAKIGRQLEEAETAKPARAAKKQDVPGESEAPGDTPPDAADDNDGDDGDDIEIDDDLEDADEFDDPIEEIDVDE